MPNDVTQYRERLFYHAYRKTKRSHVAEDVVQEAYSRWYQADRSGVDVPYAWLLTVVNRLCVEYWRRGARELCFESVNPSNDAAAPESGLEQWCDVVDAVAIATQSLSAEQRAALILRDVFDWPYADVAETLKKSNAACRQLVHRARAILQHLRREELRPRSIPMVSQFVEALREEDAAAALALVAREHAAA